MISSASHEQFVLEIAGPNVNGWRAVLAEHESCLQEAKRLAEHGEVSRALMTAQDAWVATHGHMRDVDFRVRLSIETIFRIRGVLAEIAAQGPWDRAAGGRSIDEIARDCDWMQIEGPLPGCDRWGRVTETRIFLGRPRGDGPEVFAVELCIRGDATQASRAARVMCLAGEWPGALESMKRMALELAEDRMGPPPGWEE